MRDPLERFEQFFRQRYYKELMEVAREYPEKRSIEIDYSDIDKFDVDLADKLLTEPDEYLKIAKDAISEIDLPIEGEYSLNVRISNLPASQEIGVRDLRAEHIEKLVAVEGVIKSAADVRPEAVRATFECPECKHQWDIPQITQRLIEPYICGNPTCARKGKFKLVDTELLDAQRIKIQESPEKLIGGEQPSQLYIHLTDDLVSPLERKKILPGNTVRIVGILRKRPIQNRMGIQTTSFDLYLSSNHIRPIVREFEEIELTKEDIGKIKKMSKDPGIYEKLTGSLAPSIYGYPEVKEAILMQLMGGVPKVQPDGTRIRGNIHIFLLGDPAVGKSQMLWYVSALAPKGRFVSGKKASGVGLTAAVVRDDFAGGWTLEAGALILANNGIVCVDEFDKMESDDRSAMLEAMEQGTISVAKAGIVTTLKANTAVLAAANPKYGRFDSYRPIFEQIKLSPVILSRFDLKFPIRDIPDKKRDIALVDHVLNSFVSPVSIEPEIDTETVRKYIAYARRLKPQITKEAQRTIREFYLEWRGRYVGEGEDATVALTPRQLEALVRISEASAKVRLADKVTVDDARRATKLLETSLRALGTEPETGKIDIDRIEAGTSSVQRSKIHTMLKLIEDLTKEVGKDVPIDDLLEKAADQGIDKTTATELVSKLKQKGDLYEPKPGFLRAA